MRSTITLQPREPPLTPVGVAATAMAIAGLAAATCRRLSAGAELYASAGDGWLVVLGEADALPWADGCVYLGRDGALLLPTTRRAQPSADLVAGALRRMHDDGLLVLLDDVVLHGPSPARPADGALLKELA